MHFWGSFLLAMAVGGAVSGFLVSFIFQRDWLKKIGIAGGGDATSIYRFEKATIRGLLLGTLIGGALMCASFFAPSYLEEKNGGVILVVDGDTIKVGGQRLRLKGIATPEILDAQCEAEKVLGEKAKAFLNGVVSGGLPYIHYTGEFASGKRPLVVLYANGKNVNDMLVRAKHAVKWDGTRPLFCPPIDPTISQ